MIREPTVGMRVEVIDGHGGAEIGNIGVITDVDRKEGYCFIDFVGSGQNCEGLYKKRLTEIKESDMKKGDLVTITDGSYCVRVDAFQEDKDYIGTTSHPFKVVGFTNNSLKSGGRETIVHDIFVEDTRNGKVYLHSKSMVKPIKPKVKYLTVADLEKKYGCKVKIVK